MNDLGKKSIDREVSVPSRDASGLIIQSMEVGPKREFVEAHNRDRFVNHFHYSDTTQGNPKTFDPTGNYSCGTCNMAVGNKCLLVNTGTSKDPLTVDLKAGSCGDWEKKCAGDPEILLAAKTPEVASYGVAANGMGFGCKRCPYASPAVEADSQGRSLYCGKGDFRVFPDACCALNGAALQKENIKEPRHGKIGAMLNVK